MSIRTEMIAEAMEKHGDIRPTGGRAVLQDCFTEFENPRTGKTELLLWYDGPAVDAAGRRSTHMIRKELMLTNYNPPGA
jgi:hypothetical protein